MAKHDHSQDEFFMRRALSLAANGRGNVSPNPLVGCVITTQDRVIGEGWHKSYGGPHAEVNAINTVTDKSLLLESTLYVSLEPCNHFGKTPPCTDLIIGHQIRKVVICNIDTNPLVEGTGVNKLRQAGVEVFTGILEKEGRALNKRFFTFMEKQRPHIILKWAETADGFIARENYDSKWISNDLSRQRVHKWRSEEDAVLVGARTAFHDNPMMNVRSWSGRNPVRVVIDRFLKLNEKLHLFDGSQRTFCYNVLRHEERDNLSLIRIDETDFLQHLVHDLYNKNIQSVIIEGGRYTLESFIRENLWDEILVFKSRRTFGKGITAPSFEGRLLKTENIQGDILSQYLPSGPIV